MPINSVVCVVHGARCRSCILGNSYTKGFGFFFFFAALFLVSFFLYRISPPNIYLLASNPTYIYIYGKRYTEGDYRNFSFSHPRFGPSHICFFRKKKFSSYRCPCRGRRHCRAPPLLLCSPAGSGTSSVGDCMAMAVWAGS